jgi:hypothetical protein
MPHIWRRDVPLDDPTNGWSASVLEADAVVLPGAPAAVLRRHRGSAGESWVLLAPPSVRVNGIAVDAGMRVLRDRDELVAGGERCFFSSELLAVVVPMPAAERAVICPRCLLEIVPGSPAVRCPRCSVWHHQTDEYPCWAYSPTCSLCQQPSALGAGFQWTPEGT